MFSLLSERKEEGETETLMQKRNIDQLPSHMCPNRGRTHNPGHVPWLGIEHATFRPVTQRSNQLSHTGQGKRTLSYVRKTKALESKSCWTWKHITSLETLKKDKAIGRGLWKFIMITFFKKFLDPNSRKVIPHMEYNFPILFPVSFLSVSPLPDLFGVCASARLWCTECKTSSCPVTPETAALGILPKCWHGCAVHCLHFMTHV